MMTFSITTLSMIDFIVTFKIIYIQHEDTQQKGATTLRITILRITAHNIKSLFATLKIITLSITAQVPLG
jgi:hypothetical protein